MSVTSIEICAQALVMIGAEPITSFVDGTTESKVAGEIYEVTVRDLLTRHPWRFAMIQQQLNRLTAGPPLSTWGAAYQVPADTMLIREVLVNGHPIDYDRFEDRIFCGANEQDEVILQSIYRVNEQFWPPYFVTLAVLQLASIFAYSVANQIQLSDFIEKKVLRHLAISRSLDSQAQTTRRLDVQHLITGRQ
jgi:hypothetical protein